MKRESNNITYLERPKDGEQKSRNKAAMQPELKRKVRTQKN